MKRRNAIAVVAVLALVVLAAAGAISAIRIDQRNPGVEEAPVAEGAGGIEIPAAKNLGRMYTDGDGDTASAAPNGYTTVSAGYNVFTANYTHVNDEDGDGQGAIYRLTVYDARSIAHTKQIDVDRATDGTISVAFDSHGSGDAQYELWCETHDLFDTEKASDIGTGDLDYI
ncbi:MULTISPECIES: hypothetical protein [unclassified Methanoculleus]|jgi:hypothetical protein|uniref:Secreted protein n=1 Tax=Methanoculleus palmolei TaxID=72612 RepID=A0ABD8AAF9_9EURY|nr:hypothetical protein [Methanoculleus sp. UBA377]MDD2474227.1 hypothetical protein [Methanoculleus sp.]WOX56504.1 hypothetical protein R6Y95_04015 [Methanoculleus palmolei]